MSTKKMIEHLRNEEYSEFRKEYIPDMKAQYKKNEAVVKEYVCKRISLGKKTYI